MSTLAIMGCVIGLLLVGAACGFLLLVWLMNDLLGGISNIFDRLK